MKDKARETDDLLVSRNLQIRLLLHSMLFMLFAVVVTVIIMMYPVLPDLYFSTNIDFRYHAAQGFIFLIEWLIPIVVALFAVFAVHQIMITHRVCGPLVNFTATFDKMLEGDFTRRVALRRGDFLQQECAKINDIIDSLSAVIRRTREDHGSLMAELESLDTRCASGGVPETVVSAVASVRAAAQRIAEDLAKFKVE
jgi:methyl-accepting chemotaxis protein